MDESTSPSPRPVTPRSVYYLRRFGVAVILVVVVVGFVVLGLSISGENVAKKNSPPRSPTDSNSPSPTAGGNAPTAFLPPLVADAPSYLEPGSDPSVLPGPILIADKLNNRLVVVDPEGHLRWVWPEPGDLAPGQTFLIPDDAFFSPDGRYIIATQEDNFVITVIDPVTRKIVWRYGHPGVPGSGPGYLWNPDDAMILPDGTVIAADIKNCRIIEIPQNGTAVSWQEGTASCFHNPPRQYGSPNGVFPLPDGHFLVTEINGDWVDDIDIAGHVFWSVHPPAVNYPSDSNQASPGRYLTVDYSSPGQVVVFDQAGQTLWRYRATTPPAELNHPSLGIALPNGDILLNDDHNHRVIVIDPSTDRIVWQYGHDQVAGSAAGYLDNPDGLDPLPPYSYADLYQPH